MAEPLEPRALFGGAISIAIPARFTDVSAFRQVPDTQEVFAHAETDQSIIVELLEMAEEASDPEAALFHFQSLAHDNDSSANEIEQPCLVQQPNSDTIRTVCWGLQRISKFNEAGTNNVRIFVCCYRLKNVTTDLVISFNAPQFVNAASSSAKGVDPSSFAQHSVETNTAMFQQIIETLQVSDWSLFGQQ